MRNEFNFDMKLKYMNILVVVAMIILRSVEAGNISYERSQIVFHNEPMNISCEDAIRNESRVEWSFRGVGSTSKDDVIIGNNGFKVTSFGTGNSLLSLNRTQFAYAGVYTCKVYRSVYGVATETFSASTQLIVLDLEPSCEFNSSLRSGVPEGHQVHLQCRYRYKGSLTPAVQWRNSKSDTVISHNVTPSSDGLTSVVSFPATVSLHGTTYRFSIHFSSEEYPNSTDSQQRSIYNRSFTFPPLNVIYGPRNISIQPSRKLLKLGEFLECSAESNPSSLVIWRNVDTEVVITGPRLLIGGSMSRETTVYSYECTVTNNIVNSNISKVIHFTVDNKACTWRYYVYALMTVVAVLSIVILLLIGLLHQSKQKGRSKISSIVVLEPPFVPTETNNYSEIEPPPTGTPGSTPETNPTEFQAYERPTSHNNQQLMFPTYEVAISLVQEGPDSINNVPYRACSEADYITLVDYT